MPRLAVVGLVKEYCPRITNNEPARHPEKLIIIPKDIPIYHNPYLTPYVDPSKMLRCSCFDPIGGRKGWETEVTGPAEALTVCRWNLQNKTQPRHTPIFGVGDFSKNISHLVAWPRVSKITRILPALTKNREGQSQSHKWCWAQRRRK